VLNYIWLSLLLIGILVAVGNDWRDLSTDKYRNGAELPALLILDEPPAGELTAGRTYQSTLEFAPGDLAGLAEPVPADPVLQRAAFTPGPAGSGPVVLTADAATPALWQEMAKALRKETVSGTLRLEGPVGGGRARAILTLDPVKFVHLNAVTNDGFIRYAKTAVELAIGLIGVMALWLGVMKIAEQSGLVAKIAAAVRPVTTRLFPDVPPDHPAMGAMIMNISANMLGLANAATPLGLKAMEELNKLNTKLGTATDAMCTFLVINTSSVQLIPATVIALRASAGSANPTEIIGPVIFATTVNTVVGIITVKLLARLPFFRRQLQSGEARA
jgi:spore maturation protein A